MEKLIRRLSESFFLMNYVGIIAGGAFTFIHASEKK